MKNEVFNKLAALGFAQAYAKNASGVFMIDDCVANGTVRVVCDEEDNGESCNWTIIKFDSPLFRSVLFDVKVSNGATASDVVALVSSVSSLMN